MLDSMQKALIKKDFRSVTTNKRLFPALVIVPLVMALIYPAILVAVIALMPVEGTNFQMLTNLLPDDMVTGDLRQSLLQLFMNNIVPLFFLIIPIMAGSIMAASSFVGEKEKKTLETLLYCPLTLRQIFSSKILASFLLSMMVSLISFLAMFILVEIETFLLFGNLIVPGIGWLLLIVLVSPAVTIIAITIIVRGSAKAQTMEESQQRSAFLIIPILLLLVFQLTGLLVLDAWVMLVLGVVLALFAWVLIRNAFSRFSYESLLL